MIYNPHRDHRKSLIGRCEREREMTFYYCVYGSFCAPGALSMLQLRTKLLRRPVWFFKSTIFAEIDEKVIGFVRSRWHPWRRICDLYLGKKLCSKKQFASMENPGFWNWTFVVKDETGQILALIDRDYRSWGYETLTDASQYIVRFGKAASADGSASPSVVPEKVGDDDLEDDDGDNVIFTVDRHLTLKERACTLALLISLDNDYFSRHSGGAWLIPIPFFMGSGGQ